MTVVQETSRCHAVRASRHDDSIGKGARTSKVIFETELTTFLDTAEERGVVEEAELEAVAFEHGLAEKGPRGWGRRGVGGGGRGGGGVLGRGGRGGRLGGAGSGPRAP